MATISIADSDARVQYTQAVTANSTTLTIDFPFFSLDDINVIVTSAAGVDTTLTRGTGTGTFAVNGTSVDDGFSGGNITLGDTYSDAATKFTIFRDIPVTRTSDFPTSGPFNISALNTELDKIFAIEQELETKVGRTMKLADSDTAATLSLPNLDTRKGTVLAFNTTTGLPEAGPKIGDVSSIAAITADIGTLADIEDGTDATDAIQTVAGISSNVTTVAGISSNVSTVAGISANVTTVAGNNSNVTTVAGINSDITTVAGISANVTTVANDGTDIGTVAGMSSNINTVAGISANVTTVAGISSDVTTVAGDAADIATVAGDSANIQSLAAVSTEIGRLGTADAVSDLNTLATSAIVTDMDALANIATELDALGDITANITTVAGISANVTTVAGISANTTTVAGIASNVTSVAGVSSNVTTVAGISSDVSTVAARDSDIGTVAAADTNIGTVASNISNVNSVGGSIANVNTVASNLSGVNSFGERYRVSANAPTTSLDAGDLWFDTTNNTMKVYGSSGFTAAGSSVNGTSNRSDYVVGTSSGSYTGSTTVFPHTYDAGYVDVYLNGIKLQPADFTATNGTSVTLGSAAQTNDTVSLVGYGTFELTNFAIGSANNVDTTGHLTGHALVYNGTNYVPSDQGIETHLGGDGTNDGVSISDGLIEMRAGGSSPAQIDMYCEVSNAHKVSIKAPAHANYTGNVNFTLPANNGTNGQVLSTDGSGNLSYTTVDLTALSASNLTSGTIPDARFPATLPAVSGANLTGISTDLVGDTSPQLGGTLDTNGQAIQFGSSKWTIELSGNNLLFKYNGTAKIKFAEDGEIVTVDDVTAFGSI